MICFLVQKMRRTSAEEMRYHSTDIHRQFFREESFVVMAMSVQNHLHIQFLRSGKTTVISDSGDLYEKKMYAKRNVCIKNTPTKTEFYVRKQGRIHGTRCAKYACFSPSKITRDIRTDRRTNGRMEGRTQPLIEMRRRIYKCLKGLN